jgi:hypothetical protein
MPATNVIITLSDRCASISSTRNGFTNDLCGDTSCGETEVGTDRYD